MFAAGAGHYPGPRNYTECCFASMVSVSFALETQRPHIPETMGVLEEVQEARVETICLSEEVVRRAVEALKGQVRGNLELWAAFTLRRVVMD